MKNSAEQTMGRIRATGEYFRSEDLETGEATRKRFRELSRLMLDEVHSKLYKEGATHESKIAAIEGCMDAHSDLFELGVKVATQGQDDISSEAHSVVDAMYRVEELAYERLGGMRQAIAAEVWSCYLK